MEKRICSSCNLEQDINQFGKYKNRDKEYRRTTCYKCRRNTENMRYASNPEVREKMKKRVKEYILKKEYNLTQEQYNMFYIQQKGRCKICNKNSNKTLNVDHCHISSKVRGLLCWNCNIGLGYFKDSIKNLENAINYLKS